MKLRVFVWNISDKCYYYQKKALVNKIALNLFNHKKADAQQTSEAVL